MVNEEIKKFLDSLEYRMGFVEMGSSFKEDRSKPQKFILSLEGMERILFHTAPFNEHKTIAVAAKVKDDDVLGGGIIFKESGNFKYVDIRDTSQKYGKYPLCIIARMSPAILQIPEFRDCSLVFVDQEYEVPRSGGEIDGDYIGDTIKDFDILCAKFPRTILKED